MTGLGARLLALRTKRGLSLRSVARETGISPGALCQYEHDKAVPLLDTAAALARFFGVSLDWLARGETEIESERAMLPEEV